MKLSVTASALAGILKKKSVCGCAACSSKA